MALKNTSATLTINGGEERSLGSGSTRASFPGTGPLYQHQVNLTDGTGANKAQKVGLAGFSLTSGASVTFDLTAFPGPYGNVNFSVIRDCVIDNQGTGPTDVLEVGNAASNAWTSPFAGTNPRVKSHPGAPVRLPSPIAGFVVDATHKNLMVANTGTNTVGGNVLLLGEGT